jgi:hypothetical protein
VGGGAGSDYRGGADSFCFGVQPLLRRRRCNRCRGTPSQLPMSYSRRRQHRLRRRVGNSFTSQPTLQLVTCPMLYALRREIMAASGSPLRVIARALASCNPGQRGGASRFLWLILEFSACQRTRVKPWAYNVSLNWRVGVGPLPTWTGWQRPSCLSVGPGAASGTHSSPRVNCACGAQCK